MNTIEPDVKTQIEAQTQRLLLAKATKLDCLEEIERLKGVMAEQDRIVADASAIITGLRYGRPTDEHKHGDGSQSEQSPR